MQAKPHCARNHVFTNCKRMMFSIQALVGEWLNLRPTRQDKTMASKTQYLIALLENDDKNVDKQTGDDYE